MNFCGAVKTNPKILGVLNMYYFSTYFQIYWGCYCAPSTPSSTVPEIWHILVSFWVIEKFTWLSRWVGLPYSNLKDFGMRKIECNKWNPSENVVPVKELSLKMGIKESTYLDSLWKCLIFNATVWIWASSYTIYY